MARFLPEVFDQRSRSEAEFYCDLFAESPTGSHQQFVNDGFAAPLTQVNLDDYTSFMNDYCGELSDRPPDSMPSMVAVPDSVTFDGEIVNGELCISLDAGDPTISGSRCWDNAEESFLNDWQIANRFGVETDTGTRSALLLVSPIGNTMLDVEQGGFGVGWKQNGHAVAVIASSAEPLLLTFDSDGQTHSCRMDIAVGLCNLVPE